MSGRTWRVAIAGNPNAGKTTLFNTLTGVRHRVANYPGTTVESREGRLQRDGEEILLVDLPGTYSLSSYSDDERVARHELVQRRPDLVVQVLDASNLERNLYLTTQLIDLGLPLVLALNMSDVAEQSGVRVDAIRLSELLGVPAIPTVGRRGEGGVELADAIVRALRAEPPPRPRPVRYGDDIERAIGEVAAALAGSEGAKPDVRWRALQLLEGDAQALAALAGRPEALGVVERARDRLRALGGDSPAMLIAERRYGFTSGVCAAAAQRTAETRHTWSDRVDEFLAHPVLGVPVFLAVMYAMFALTFRLGERPMEWIERGFGWVGEAIGRTWPAGRAEIVRSLLVDGVIAGVGGVVSFLPNILLLFAAIALLEDSGYLARAALLSDRLMRRIGLHGRSFIPLLVGFGCTVPAILATRVLENRRDRLTTMLILPLISCGARLPIYALLIPAFFPARLRAPMLWGMYLIGIVLAVLVALLLRRTLFRGGAEPLILELPPYRLPTLRGVLAHMFERGLVYLRKAATLILAVSVLLWALMTFPRLPAPADGAPPDPSAALAHSAAGRIGRAIEPVLRPMGFDWRIGTAMIGAFAAKEVFVAQLGIVFSLDAGDDVGPLRERLQRAYSPLAAFCMMLFMLVATPCMATVAVTRRESGSWGWAALQFFGLTLLAWLLTTAVYQIGRLVTGG